MANHVPIWDLYLPSNKEKNVSENGYWSISENPLSNDSVDLMDSRISKDNPILYNGKHFSDTRSLQQHILETSPKGDDEAAGDVALRAFLELHQAITNHGQYAALKKIHKKHGAQGLHHLKQLLPHVAKDHKHHFSARRSILNKDEMAFTGHTLQELSKKRSGKSLYFQWTKNPVVDERYLPPLRFNTASTLKLDGLMDSSKGPPQGGRAVITSGRSNSLRLRIPGRSGIRFQKENAPKPFIDRDLNLPYPNEVPLENIPQGNLDEDIPEDGGSNGDPPSKEYVDSGNLKPKKILPTDDEEIKVKEEKEENVDDNILDFIEDAEDLWRFLIEANIEDVTDYLHMVFGYELGRVPEAQTATLVDVDVNEEDEMDEVQNNVNVAPVRKFAIVGGNTAREEGKTATLVDVEEDELKIAYDVVQYNVNRPVRKYATVQSLIPQEREVIESDVIGANLGDLIYVMSNEMRSLLKEYQNFQYNFLDQGNLNLANIEAFFTNYVSYTTTVRQMLSVWGHIVVGQNRTTRLRAFIENLNVQSLPEALQVMASFMDEYQRFISLFYNLKVFLDELPIGNRLRERYAYLIQSFSQLFDHNVFYISFVRLYLEIIGAVNHDLVMLSVHGEEIQNLSQNNVLDINTIVRSASPRPITINFPHITVGGPSNEIRLPNEQNPLSEIPQFGPDVTNLIMSFRQLDDQKVEWGGNMLMQDLSDVSYYISRNYQIILDELEKHQKEIISRIKAARNRTFEEKKEEFDQMMAPFRAAREIYLQKQRGERLTPMKRTFSDVDVEEKEPSFIYPQDTSRRRSTYPWGTSIDGIFRVYLLRTMETLVNSNLATAEDIIRGIALVVQLTDDVDEFLNANGANIEAFISELTYNRVEYLIQRGRAMLQVDRERLSLSVDAHTANVAVVDSDYWHSVFQQRGVRNIDSVLGLIVSIMQSNEDILQNPNVVSQNGIVSIDGEDIKDDSGQADIPFDSAPEAQTSLPQRRFLRQIDNILREIDNDNYNTVLKYLFDLELMFNSRTNLGNIFFVNDFGKKVLAYLYAKQTSVENIPGSWSIYY